MSDNQRRSPSHTDYVIGAEGFAPDTEMPKPRVPVYRAEADRDADLPKIVQARLAAWRVMRGDSEGNFTGESPAEQRYMSKHWPTESGAIPAPVRDFDKEPLTPEEEAERDRWLEENNPTAEELQAAIDEADRG